MELKELFSEISALNDDQIKAFEDYSRLLVSYNEKVNLTAITDKDEINLKHFYDSCLPLKSGYFKEEMTVIDVGCGAGFPSIPLKIVMPSLKFTLMDATKKKTDFIEKAVSELCLKDVSVVNMRAEEAAHMEEYLEKFDMSVARAVAPLNVLLEYCVPFINRGGYFAALKGKNASEEIGGAKKAADILGVKLADVFEYTLPGTDNIRNIIIYEKIKSTDGKYPRKPGRPSKEPL